MTYALPFTTMAVEGPERYGSGKGVPVPRRTTWVLGIASFCACEMPYQVKRNKTVNPTAPRFRRFAIISLSPVRNCSTTGMLGPAPLLHQTVQEMRFSTRAAQQESRLAE